MDHRRFLGTACILSIAASASAGPVTASFSSGTVTGAGFPEPIAQQSPVSTTSKRSGGGATGGGFAGSAFASVQITPTDVETQIQLLGTAAHANDFGYTAAYTNNEVVFTLTQAATFKITNQSTTVVGSTTTPFVPVTFANGTGTITSFSASTGELTPGTYKLRFGVAAGRDNTFSFSVVSTWYNQFTATGCNSTSVNWKLTLRTPCHGDFNGDGFVDDADFSPFVTAYDILSCSGGGMPQGCPADFNNDGFVDDADFLLFVASYNVLICA